MDITPLFWPTVLIAAITMIWGIFFDERIEPILRQRAAKRLGIQIQKHVTRRRGCLMTAFLGKYKNIGWLPLGQITLKTEVQLTIYQLMVFIILQFLPIWITFSILFVLYFRSRT